MKKIRKFILLIASVVVFTTSVHAYGHIYNPAWMSAIVDSQVLLHIKFEGEVMVEYRVATPYDCNLLAKLAGGGAWSFDTGHRECIVFR